MKTNNPSDLWRRVMVLEPDECWEWRGARNAAGYGVFSLNGRDVGAHRLAYELATGQPPGELMVLHHCDNPPCCNPSHLYAGTGADNQRDAKDRGRRASRAGSKHHLAKLTEAQVIEIRARRMRGERGSQLAREFGISQATICRIHRGQGWTHVQEEAAA